MSDALADVSRTFSGRILQSTDAGYEEARTIHNGLIDKRPKLIACCHGLADVAAAVTLARDLNLEIAVRGGGHNVAGRATTDGGMMIDLSPMRGIQVDPAARTARAQGGATWGLFNRETQLHGLATTGGTISTTGIGGLTLGGGLGWIMGKYALAADNLLSVDVVLADGTIIRASEANHPDLFWGLRGGGGNFGVAASFEYRLHPVGPTITGGIVAHPFNDARDVLRFYRDATRSLPDECIVLGGLIHAPDGSGTKLAAIVACHCGPLADGEAALHRFKSFGTPVIDTMGAMSYCDINTMLDGGFPRGARNYWKSSFLQSLSDEAIRAMVDRFDACPAPLGAVILEHLHGAVARVGATETAFPHRTEGYNLLVLSQWLGAADDTACIRWARETHDAMAPFMGSGRYANYLDDDDQGVASAAYGPNYARLRTIKAKYDPDNVFHKNLNIQPMR